MGCIDKRKAYGARHKAKGVRFTRHISGGRKVEGEPAFAKATAWQGAQGKPFFDHTEIY